MTNVCTFCGLDMQAASTCVPILVKGENGELPPVPYGSEINHAPAEGRRCHDCNVEPGGLHHPGCDWEECPACHHQVISCGCEHEQGDDDW